MVLLSEAIGRLDKLRANPKACPHCGETIQIQLKSHHWPAYWRCRKCGEHYDGEPERDAQTMTSPRPPGIAAAVRRAKRRERERCASLALLAQKFATTDDGRNVAVAIADAIRNDGIAGHGENAQEVKK